MTAIDRSNEILPPGRRAAIYVRMSSGRQDHSIQHQIDRLSAYAQENGFSIVMMYADSGKSGLRINGRDGLRGLIADVQSGSAHFSTVWSTTSAAGDASRM